MIIKELDEKQAIECFEKIPIKKQYPSNHPSIIVCDSFRSKILKPTFWYAEENNKFLLHSFFLNYNKNFNFFDIESSYGYGGPIGNNKSKVFINKVSNYFTEWCNKKNIIAEFLRFHPLNNHSEFYWGKSIKNRSTIVINLENELFDNYKKGRKTDITTANKNGFHIRQVDPNTMNKHFPLMYYNNMEVINASKFYFFSSQYFENLFKSSLVDNWLVFKGEEVISGAVIFKSYRSKTIEYHLSARKNFTDKSIVFLIHNIAKFYKELQFKNFFLGGGRSSSPEDSLLFFKKGFSSYEKEFKIGYKIYNESKYKELKAKFKISNEKILFYR
mgnify:CR=1 FL=1